MEVKYIIYFFIGGIIISLVTYFASHAKGLLAAFFANLPVMTFLTFLTIYFEAGERAVTEYAKGLIIMLFPWLGYIFCIIFLTERLGLIPSLATGLTVYFIFSYIIIYISNIKWF
ncbi:MAG: hypothetical protein N2511_08310 [Thermodesulfovibrionales bacterium]|nr:hypothetical protein [Thermodesulfovibrionales bacterium]